MGSEMCIRDRAWSSDSASDKYIFFVVAVFTERKDRETVRRDGGGDEVALKNFDGRVLVFISPCFQSTHAIRFCSLRD